MNREGLEFERGIGWRMVLRVWVLAVLPFVMLVVLVTEGGGPLDEYCTVSYHRTLSRAALGYSELPEFETRMGRYRAYRGGDRAGDWWGSCWWDEPYWPTPVALPAAQPPPLVRRTVIVGIAKGPVLSALALLWLVIAVSAARHVRSQGRRDPVVCPRCRYDLTGNVSGVCPECGTPVAAAAAGGAMEAPHSGQRVGVARKS